MGRPAFPTRVALATVLQFLLVMAVAAAALSFVVWPLRAGAPIRTGIDPRLLEARDRAQLAKDRKLDEIRELRADRAAGKLASADAAPMERALRAEAAELLHALDEAEAAIDEARARLGVSGADEALDGAHTGPGDPVR